MNTIDRIENGKKLVMLRGEKTVREVADTLGISASALSMYESGQRVPRDNVKVKISNYYGVAVDALFF